MTRKAPVLSPQKREILLDALRAPRGYEIDAAVGTTFSVDLGSALLVPMAFALFDTESGELERNPVEVLAATRSYAGRIALYCEQGRIAAAAKQPSVLAYLEPALHPVAPPPRGSFHPKLWVLRFRASDGVDVRHRVLCLSRNLTFDRSWDTLLRLEETNEEAGDPAKVAPLITFLQALNERSPSQQAQSLPKTLADATFTPPAGFSDFDFVPLLGDSDERSAPDPLAAGGDSVLIVSPFLSPDRIESAAARWGSVHLASRPETLDRMPPELLRQLKGVYEFDAPDEAGGTAERGVPMDEAVADALGLTGLHAKIHSAERGKKSFLLVGSANATGAAFTRNVEFGVVLHAPNRTAGPRYLLKGEGDPSQLRTLLRDYDIRDEPREDTDDELELKRLEALRREMSDIALTVEVSRESEEQFVMEVRSIGKIPALEASDKLTCWPITLTKEHAIAVSTDGNPLARFKVAALTKTSGLICFKLESPRSAVPALEFTLVAQLVGDIEGRVDAVMGEILDDHERLMRFLLLLLAAGSDEADAFGSEPLPGPGTTGTGFGPAWEQIPLLETLLRTYARDRGRLKAFDEALRSFRRLSEDGKQIPAGLLKMWEPIEAALKADGGRTDD